jgi:tRNA1Val (adenine37-N6)-methyltransferase
MDAVSEFLAVTAEVDLFPNRQLLVRTKEGAPIKRSLLEFKRKAMPFQPEELLLEVAQNVRSAAYQTLAADFYL